MSEEPPQGTPAGEPTKAADAPATGAAAPASPGALDDAAKAMATALPEDKPPAAPPTNTATTGPAITSVAPPPLDVAPPAANTSGMHLQYVAPGVKRQSVLQDMKWQALIFCAILGFTALVLFRTGGVDGDLAGPGANTTTTSNQNQTSPNGQQHDPVGPAPTDDTPYVPTTRMPTADLTVNAGAIGDTTTPLGQKGKDAGVNKGGYADERKDLEAAEAMIATNPDKALAMVDQHDKDYPRGIMDPDARMIRIEAFQKKGDDAKALALGNEFLEDYPHSGPASHVQEIVEALKKKNGN